MKFWNSLLLPFLSIIQVPVLGQFTQILGRCQGLFLPIHAEIIEPSARSFPISLTSDAELRLFQIWHDYVAPVPTLQGGVLILLPLFPRPAFCYAGPQIGHISPRSDSRRAEWPG